MSSKFLRISTALVVASTITLAQGDDCAAATLLVGAGTGVVQTTPIATAGFSIAGPVASCNGLTDALDGFYMFIPTVNGIATFATCTTSATAPGGNAGGVDSYLAAYDGSAGCPLTLELACNDDCGPLTSEITVAVTAGTAVYVQVGDWASGGPISGTLAYVENAVTASAGDTCANADTGPLAGPGVYAYNSLGFVLAGPTAGCNGLSDTQDYWFQYTATTTGLAIVSNCNTSVAAPGGSISSGPDTTISGWDGSTCPPTLELACADGSPDCGIGPSEVVFPVTAGTSYYIQVTDWAVSGPISGAISIVETPAAANDECTGAIPIFANVPVTVSNASATTSVPSGLCSLSTGDLWYSFTSPCSGDIIIETCASGGFDSVVAVWDNCVGAGGMQIACNDDAVAGPCAGTLMSFVQLSGVTTGSTVYISVGGWAGGTGTVTLNVHCKYTHNWTVPSGAGSIQLENVDGPANAVAISAITVDILHPGLPPAVNFPNGWFFGVPMGFQELQLELLWPGGLPFVGLLDANGYLLNFTLGAGATSGLAGIATIWSVGVGLDPLTGFSSVADVTDPTAFPL